MPQQVLIIGGNSNHPTTDDRRQETDPAMDGEKPPPLSLQCGVVFYGLQTAAEARFLREFLLLEEKIADLGEKLSL